jgi:acyl-coenzyme A thioesterase PaaI-like protein
MSRLKNNQNAKDMPKLEDDFMCFVCGKNNKQGLKLTFELDADIMTTQFIPRKKHQGFANIVHGGIISTVLDEIMLNLLYRKKIYALTAELAIRFLKPCYVNEKLFFTSSIEDDRGRLILTKAQAKNENNEIVATAQAKCVVIKKGN